MRVLVSTLIVLTLLTSAEAQSQGQPDCITPDPAHMMGIGRAFREAGTELVIPNSVAPSNVGFEAAFVAALPNTARLDSELGAVAIGETAQVLVASLEAWAPDLGRATITSALDRSAPVTGFIATDTILLPALQTLNTAYETLPSAQAKAFGDILNPAIAGINPQLAAVLCQQFGLPMEMPFPVGAADFAGISTEVEQYLTANLAGAAAPPDLSVQQILDASESPSLNRVLMGEGSLFRGALGAQYPSALGDPATLSDTLNSGGELFAPVNLNAQQPSQEDLARGLTEASVRDGQTSPGQGGSVGDSHLEQAKNSCFDCIGDQAVVVGVATATSAAAGGLMGGGAPGAIIWGSAGFATSTVSAGLACAKPCGDFYDAAIKEAEQRQQQQQAAVPPASGATPGTSAVPATPAAPGTSSSPSAPTDQPTSEQPSGQPSSADPSDSPSSEAAGQDRPPDFGDEPSFTLPEETDKRPVCDRGNGGPGGGNPVAQPAPGPGDGGGPPGGVDCPPGIPTTNLFGNFGLLP